MLSSMKKSGWILAAALLIQVGPQVAFAQDTTIKIAVCDLEQVFVLSTDGKALQEKLAKFQQDAQSEGERLTKEANDLRQRAADGGQSLTAEKLAELQKQYEDKAIAIRRFRDDKQREAEKMKNEGLKEIETKLEPVFKAIRDERGYDLILNNVPGIVVMANEKVDITRDIVERLNGSSGG